MAARPRTSRRRWSETFKKRVVADASELGMTVTQIARRYDLDARRGSNWMNKFGSGVALVPVEVTSVDCPYLIKLGHYDAANERSHATARKRYSDEDCLKLLRAIEVELASGSEVPTACRAAGISDAAHYTWRKKFGSMGRSQLAEVCITEI